MIDFILTQTGAELQNLINKIAPTEEKVTQLSEAVGQYEKNDEYIRVYADAAGVFLFGIKKDGSIEWAKGIPTPVKKYVEERISATEGTISEFASVILAAFIVP